MSDHITLPREDIISEADAWLKMNGLASDRQTCFRMALFAQHISALAAPRFEVTIDPRTTPDEAAAISSALAAPAPEPVAVSDDEEFTRERVVALLLEVMDWTYVQADRDRPMTDAEKKVIDDIRTDLAAPQPERVEPTPRITRITCGFSDVQFDGERWRCWKCGERMPANYEVMVKHYGGDKDYLELMQRKADHKAGRNMK